MDGGFHHRQKYRQKSWNYIAPGKHDLVNWCLEAWEKVKTMRHLLQSGCNSTYMNLDRDEAMSKFDNYAQFPYGEEDDFDKHDWEAELESMNPIQKFNLWLSPLNWVVDLETKTRKTWALVFEI